MPTVRHIQDFLGEFAPLSLAEDWDNVGLLIGRYGESVQRVMTCLTITPESVQEAIEKRVDLVVSHHPLPFKPIARITDEQTGGRMLLDLIQSSIAVYSPHTAFDSAARGINQSIAEQLSLEKIEPLEVSGSRDDGLGCGRIGEFAESASASELVNNLKSVFGLPGIKTVGDLDANVKRVAVACGSGGSFLDVAKRAECDVFITGEANFHTCLECRASNTVLILMGHYHSERFAVEQLAVEIKRRFSKLDCWASERESDPIVWR